MKLLLASVMALTAIAGSADVLMSTDYGIAPGKPFTAKDVARLLDDARSKKEPVTIRFASGTYQIEENQCFKRNWYISNHDQVLPRTVFLPVEKMSNLTIDASGATFELNGRFMFAGIWDCQNVTLEGGSIDAVTPPLTQICLLAVNPKEKTVDFRPEGNMRTSIRNGRYFVSGPGFDYAPGSGIRFEADGTIVYRTSDSSINLSHVKDLGNGTFRAEKCSNSSFRPFQRMAMRAWGRPAPGIVISNSKDTSLFGVTIFYSDGMGVLGQCSENITLDAVRVIPNRSKGRYFSAQADAVHFSACWGTVRVVNGDYEAMMDDAINVHAAYLRILRRIDDRSIEVRFMHDQSYGFEWGAKGDKIAFVSSDTLESLSSYCEMESMKPLDRPTVRSGARRFQLTFQNPLPKDLDLSKTSYGVENLTRHPEIYFENNRVANNRARGALFTSPRKTVCKNNVFDHVSGAAILLCGDCRGWFESGACHDITISGNVFIDSLTSPYEFTDAVISISPVVAKLNQQKKAFHTGILIEDNDFITFDEPLVYARSVDGMTIRNNRLTKTKSYPPYHWNRQWLTLNHCKNVKAEKPLGMAK